MKGIRVNKIGNVKKIAALAAKTLQEVNLDVEVLKSIQMAVCDQHVGWFFRLPDGNLIDRFSLNGWLLARGIDITADKWVHWMTLVGEYCCCPKPVDALQDRAFSKFLDRVFERK